MLTSHSGWWDLSTFSSRKTAIKHLKHLKQNGQARDYCIVCFKSYGGMFLTEYIINSDLTTTKK